MIRARERDEKEAISSVNGKPRKNNTTSTSGTASKSPSPKHHHPVTVEKVKMIMEKEGRSARNLLSWNIPLDNTYRQRKDRSKGKQQKSRNFQKYPHSAMADSNLGDGGSNSQEHSKKLEFNRSVSRERKKSRQQQGSTSSSDIPLSSGMGRSGDVDGGSRNKQVSFRARYWAYLFDNLRRAVDEIYDTCESDSSVVECKEVLLILDNYRHDFQALIDWIQLEQKLENTDVSNRPTSLSWEVRKSSPSSRSRPKRTNSGGGGGGGDLDVKDADAPVRILQQQQRSKIYRCLNFGASQMATHSEQMLVQLLPNMSLSNSFTNDSSNSGNLLHHRNTARGATIQHPLCASTSSAVVNRSKKNRQYPPHHQPQPNPAVASKIASLPSAATWADRVKGVSATTITTQQHKQQVTKQQQKSTAKLSAANDKSEDATATIKEEFMLVEDDDGGEWETVGRSNRQQRLHQQRSSQRSSFDNGSVKKSSSSPTSTASSSNTDLKHSPLSLKSQQHLPTATTTAAPQQQHNKKKTQQQQLQKAKPLSISGNSDDGSSKLATAARSLQSSHDKNNKQSSSEDVLSNRNIDDAKEEKDTKADAQQQQKDEEYSSSLVKLEEREATLARTLEEQHTVNIAEAEECERDLMRQLREVEEEDEDANTNEPDDTDCVDLHEENPQSSDIATCKDEETSANEEQKSSDLPMDFNDFLLLIEAEQKATAGMSWCDIVEQEESQMRKPFEPGSMVQMHEKLSSPSRKRTPAESRRKQEEKHRRAEERKQEIEKKRTRRIQELSEKVKEVRGWKEDLIQRQREFLQLSQSEKLERAKEQREQKLRKIVKKAHVEETKVNEIAFINELQEQNKRHEVLMRIDDHESRLQELELEKTRVMVMKTAKEENVKERLRAIEKERQDRIEELKVKRKEQDARIEQQKMEREKEREKLAKEKARDREMRLSARNQAHEEALSELQKKIQMKHNESERRHQEQLEIKKEKAVELSSLGRFSAACPPNTPTSLLNKVESSTSMASNCNNKDEEQNNSVTATATSYNSNNNDTASLKMATSETKNEPTGFSSQTWRKAMKKRAKKLRQRMTLRAKEFLQQLEGSSGGGQQNKSKVARIIKEVARIIAANNNNKWTSGNITSLDRLLNEIVRIMEKRSRVDVEAFRMCGGYQMLESIFTLALANNSHKQQLPDKSLALSLQVFHLSCCDSKDSRLYILYSNRIPALLDLLYVIMMNNAMKSSERNNVQVQQNKTDTNNNADNSYDDDDIFVDCVSPLIFKTIAYLLNELAANQPPRLTATTTSKKNNKKQAATVHHIISTSSTDEKKMIVGYVNRGLDVISYVVACGIFELLNNQLSQVRNLVRPDSNVASFIENSLMFLEAVTTFVAMRNRSMNTDPKNIEAPGKSGEGSNNNNNTKQDSEDPTHLLPVLHHTELMSVVSVLYGLLLHGAPQRPTQLNAATRHKQHESIPQGTLSVARAVVRMLNAAAEMDLALVQKNLGAEGVALEFRHICAYLLWYCSTSDDSVQLLHEVITCVGHFSLNNQHNQSIINSGVQPTILQQLSLLPFVYYSDPCKQDVLFPTLISCCYRNKANFTTLESELSGSILSTYIESALNYCQDHGDSSKEQETVKSLAKITRFSDDNLRLAVEFFSRKNDENGESDR